MKLASGAVCAPRLIFRVAGKLFGLSYFFSRLIWSLNAKPLLVESHCDPCYCH